MHLQWRAHGLTSICDLRPIRRRLGGSERVGRFKCLELRKPDCGRPTWREAHLFTGASFSTLARHVRGDKLPVGDGLKALLIGEFGLDAYASLDLAGLCAVLLSDRRVTLREFQERVFTVGAYDGRYDALRRLNPEFLHTTNIGDRPFHVTPAKGARVLYDVTPPRCLIPGFDGAFFTSGWKEALWAGYSMGAPRRPRGDRVAITPSSGTA